MVLLFMVLKEDTIGKTFLLPTDIRTLIPEDHVCFFIEKRGCATIIILHYFLN